MEKVMESHGIWRAQKSTNHPGSVSDDQKTDTTSATS